MAYFLMIYFMPFNFAFAPINLSLNHFNETLSAKIISFIVAFVIAISFFYLTFSKLFSRKLIKIESRNQFFVVFAATISLVFIFFAFYFLKSEDFSLKALFSIFLLVLTSYLIPFYLSINLVEKHIIQPVEAIAKPLGISKSNTKEIRKTRLDEITIESKKTNDSITFQIDNLQMVEAQGNYCMFYVCRNGKCVNKIMHITMKAVQENLSKHCQIIRCHKSFIININNVIRVSGISRSYVLHFENKDIYAPVSRIYQKDVIKTIQIIKDCVLQN